ncbi:hypothetical protein THIOM_000017 [Candidatus Thiomargarita nelsonii]|uniref:AAA+ ATPase domain-containing protein n=1 Tax=Candidatus Thiomargarita nelsonii TaxID=1003181 RepID=A0A176S883_9GAMM|nr:hypothetical protein THIOM_000017 [Candidatus Thiomargarita nelsonii]
MRVIKLTFEGNFDKRFQVRLQIAEEGKQASTELHRQMCQNSCQLCHVPNSEQKLPIRYQKWLNTYSEMAADPLSVMGHSLGRLKGTSHSNSEKLAKNCHELANSFLECFKQWLRQENSDFEKLRVALSKELKDKETEVRVIIQADDDIIKKLPWHEWELFANHGNTEIAVASMEFSSPEVDNFLTRQVKILIILGDTTGLKVDEVVKSFKELEKEKNAKITICQETSIEKIRQLLQEQWGILFFTGHSSSKDGGTISIGKDKYIQIKDLDEDIKTAIKNGLQLAIFNSCDGLGIAKVLRELNFPYAIVMKEVVPLPIATDFILSFLKAFSGPQKQSLYSAVRHARQDLKNKYKDVAFYTNWLPVISQNPSVGTSLRWEDLLKKTFKLPDNLPSVRDWVGRGEELEEMKNELFKADTRAIEITGRPVAVGVVGSPGIGKTLLASKLIRLLHDQAAPFAASAWASLRPDFGAKKPPSFHSITDSLLIALSDGKITSEMTSKDDFREKTNKLLALLKKRPCLVVLDNVESVLKREDTQLAGYFEPDCKDYAYLFDELIKREHQSKIIFTSREALVALSSSNYKSFQLHGLKHEDAIKLLKKNLDATDEKLEQLSKYYKGYPKALELVAAFIRDNCKGDVESFMEARSGDLAGDLDNILDEVFERMSDEECECLRGISVYKTDEYPLKKAGIAAQMQKKNEFELTKIIVALERRELLDYEPAYNTYSLHPFVQEKAYRLLQENEEGFKIAHQRAYKYFVGIKLEPKTQWKGVKDVKPRIRAHYHACQLEDWNEAAQVLDALGLEYLNNWSEYRLMLELLCPLIPDDWKNERRKIGTEKLQAEILRYIGIGYLMLSDYDTAKEFFKISLSLFVRLKDSVGELKALNDLGIMHYDLGEYRKAIRYYAQAIKIGDRNTETQKESRRPLHNLGVIYKETGNYRKSYSCFKKVLKLVELSKDRASEATVLNDLGHLASNLGDQKKAIEFCKKGLAISKNIGDRRAEALNSGRLGLIYCRLENYHAAIDNSEKAIEIAREIEDKQLESSVLGYLGTILRKQKRYPEALEKLQSAKKIAQEIRHRETQLETFKALAELYQDMGESKQAEHYQSRALSMAKDLQIPMPKGC